MARKHKYLLGATVVLRVPAEIAHEIGEYALLLDRQTWEKSTVFTMGSAHSHRQRVDKLLRKGK